MLSALLPDLTKSILVGQMKHLPEHSRRLVYNRKRRQFNANYRVTTDPCRLFQTVALMTSLPVLALHWLRAGERIYFKVASLALQCFHGMAKNYLSADLRCAADMLGRCHLRYDIKHGTVCSPKSAVDHWRPLSFRPWPPEYGTVCLCLLSRPQP